ncbi:MAG: type III pantothenate kinase [Winogradskyella sp.]|uniref:type III pantothenate kinase n=1 Tax=Winogradskyella sp. TaxID=1883156 RepID=UPI000F3D83B9|nr:type III pantothenate kinase [Winogradskyella sp.]RNC84134.1 MAG: type III pantothenate kinase [Winogradskyella sp.]
MNLIIDVGNTFVKFAVFEHNTLIHKESFTLEEFKKRFKSIKKKFPRLLSCIVSSVGRLKKDEVNAIVKDLNLLVLNSDTKVPFKNTYKTPKTLGVDRLALVSASILNYSNNNVLIIDAGTCITYDFITHENKYIGGAISPGIRLRYKSLNNLTANLPLLETETPKIITGNTTETSIHSGVVFGVIKEIDGVIDTYTEKYSDLTVILTGGDAKLLSEQLKNSIFANSDFLLEGLNYILEFNS